MICEPDLARRQKAATGNDMRRDEKSVLSKWVFREVSLKYQELGGQRIIEMHWTHDLYNNFSKLCKSLFVV